MLGKKDAIATVAVKDLAAARRFYRTSSAWRRGPTRAIR